MMIDKFRKLAFSSDKNNIHLVEKYVEDISDYYNINNNYFANILTAVTEAVENAITHGNNNNTAKKVYLKFEIKPEGFSFMIKDEGNGFNDKAVPDPTDPKADFSKTEGRGLYIIKSLADEIKFHHDGTCIELIFKVSSITKQMSDERIKTLLNNVKDTQNKKTQSDS